MAMSDPIAEIIGDDPAFAATQRDRVPARGIQITPYPLSHLAVRVADWDLYVHQPTLLQRYAKANRRASGMGVRSPCPRSPSRSTSSTGLRPRHPAGPRPAVHVMLYLHGLFRPRCRRRRSGVIDEFSRAIGPCSMLGRAVRGAPTSSRSTRSSRTSHRCEALPLSSFGAARGNEEGRFEGSVTRRRLGAKAACRRHGPEPVLP